MNYRSQIRDSAFQELRSKVAERNYGKYLLKVKLVKVRGFRDQTVSFDFPVTAIVGPNGGGKTTVLAAATVPYRAVMPRAFFPKNGLFDATMQGWIIEAECLDKTIKVDQAITRTARFGTFRWRRQIIDREVILFGVHRTVPLHERSEGVSLLRASNYRTNWDVTEISSEVARRVQGILGIPIAGYKIVGGDRFVELLGGMTGSGESFSEFHFGAGQSSIIRMVHRLERSVDNPLVLIEEVENGLHPVAVARLVDYLVDFAHRKKGQIIFTTHSNEALEPLPPEAIWVTIDSKVFQGKLDIKSLKVLRGYADSVCAIFVEDEFAKKWVSAILRNSQSEVVQRAEVYGMSGDGLAVKMNHHHNIDPSVRIPSICVLDGDSRQPDSIDNRILRLPGGCPERHIFDSVMGALSGNEDLLSLMLQQPMGHPRELCETCAAVGRTCMDPHLLFSQIGASLGGLAQEYVETSFIALWCRLCPDEASRLQNEIQALLA